MDNRDDQKIPLAGSYLNSVNQPPPMTSITAPSGKTTASAPYPEQIAPPPSYSAAIGQPQNPTAPQDKGLTI